MSSFTFKKKVNNNWLTLPYNVLFDDNINAEVSVMNSFYGMVFDIMKAGKYELPQKLINLPNGSKVFYGAQWISSVAVTNPIRLCIGLLHINNTPITGDGEYQISTTIGVDGYVYCNYMCTFTITNDSITNLIYGAESLQELPMHLISLDYIQHSRYVPIIFALNDSPEFNESFVTDELNIEFIREFGIPATWVKPIKYQNVHPVTITYSSDRDSIKEFNMPQSYKGYPGNIPLPSYSSLYKRNFTPKNWQIENADYPLGGVYQLPNHDVTANLIYEAKDFTGLVDM